MSELVLDYHRRTKHALARYAAGPETLDWDAQPDPWRRFDGAPLHLLPLVADALGTSWAQLHEPGTAAPAALQRRHVAALLELSFGLAAWKQLGPDRWALRCNPSSGNLHPTEAYVLTRGVTGLDDALWHYAPREHALERRAAARPVDDAAAPALWIGLSSIHWREAWKYGERAFRYCQLDAGHALGALAYAAAVLGWRARVVAPLESDTLAALLGLDRDDDFGAAEREEPELLVEIGPALAGSVPSMSWHAWAGRANRLDARPMYRWPVIDAVARATRGLIAIDAATPDATSASAITAPAPAPAPRAHEPAARLIRERRSAQAFDRRAVMPAGALQRLAAALAARTALPWATWPHAPRVHALWWLHRVDGIAPGACVQARSAHGEAVLRAALPAALEWQSMPELPLWRIAENTALAGTLRTLSCHQAIGSDACVALSLVAEFDATLADAPANYRALLQEAGLIGQVLYLNAEAEGLRGTGIGCYFDDAVHELLGLAGERMQVLYHFTIGRALVDERLRSEPPYAGRAPVGDEP